MMFRFVASIIHKANGYSVSTQLIEGHTIYLDLVKALLLRREGVRYSEKEISEVADTIGERKDRAVQLLGTLEEVSLFQLKCHLQEHVREDLSSFSVLAALYAS